MDGERMESSSTVSPLREGKLRNESGRHGTETSPLSNATAAVEERKKGVRHHGGGGLQSEASGLLALSRITAVINSLSFLSFVSIFGAFGFPLRESGTCLSLNTDYSR